MNKFAFIKKKKNSNTIRMAVKSKDREAKKWIIYVLISIPMAFGLIKVIEYKYKIIFGIYIAAMGISAIIVRWSGYSGKKSNVIRTAEYVCFVSAITLFIWYLIVKFLV